MRNIDAVTPGELLKDEFLTPMGISQYRLAKEIDVPAQRIGQIVAGKRAITADTDLRLCRFFGLSKGYWLRAQVAHDTEVAEDALANELGKIQPGGRQLVSDSTMKTPEQRKAQDDFELPEEVDFSGGVRGRFYKPRKVSTTIRIDNDVLLFLKKKAAEDHVGYQTLINTLLRDYVKHSIHDPAARYDSGDGDADVDGR